jgi:hypothetical protein
LSDFGVAATLPLLAATLATARLIATGREPKEVARNELGDIFFRFPRGLHPAFI